MEVSNVLSALGQLSLPELFRVRETLNSLITKGKNSALNTILAAKPEDYIRYEGQLLDKSSFDYCALTAELESLNINQCSNASDAPRTKWLTTTDQNYSWSSSSGHVTVKHPLGIENYNIIHSVMQDLNARYNVDLNSCLVSYFKNGQSKMKYHDDNEETLDQTSPMCILSLGAERTVDFIHHGQDGRSKPLHSLTPADGSLYIMEAGCQQFFQHRVRGDKGISSDRFSLSFRRMIPSSVITTETTLHPSQLPAQPPTTAPTLPSTIEIPERIVPSAPALSDLSGTASLEQTSTPSRVNQSPASGATRSHGPKRRKTTVIFGSSITKWIRAKNLGLKGRKVINVSNSGAKIRDLTNSLRDFYESNEEARADNIEKIIISIGTNDVKFGQHGVGHLKKYLLDLAHTAKELFPHAIVIFQSCLPIQIKYKYTVSNVLEFNSMLKNLCFEFNFVYLDCFVEFLASDYNDFNKSLYSDWLHLNGKGLAILATWLKFVVNQNSFDRIINQCPLLH